MTPEEREAFYDTEVAPTLMELAKKCQDRGLSFVAMVEWSPDGTGETVTVREGAGIKIQMASWAVKSHGNADVLIGTMVHHGEQHGHNSAYLHLLDRKVA